MEFTHVGCQGNSNVFPPCSCHPDLKLTIYRDIAYPIEPRLVPFTVSVQLERTLVPGGGYRSMGAMIGIVTRPTRTHDSYLSPKRHNDLW
jgi:hypothetical protein